MITQRSFLLLTSLLALPAMLMLSGCDGCTPQGNDGGDPNLIGNAPRDGDGKPTGKDGNKQGTGEEADPAKGTQDSSDEQERGQAGVDATYPVPGKRQLIEQTLQDGTVERANVIYDVGGRPVYDGLYTVHYPDGTLAEEATYSEGKLVGARRFFTENAQLEREEVYNDAGELTRERIHDEFTESTETFNYEAGKLNGIYRRITDKGVLQETGFYKNGQPHGEWKSYDEDGALLESSEYVDGKLHGLSITYDEQGQEVSRVRYENGQPVEE